MTQYQAKRVRNIRKWFGKQVGLKPQRYEAARLLREQAAKAEEDVSK